MQDFHLAGLVALEHFPLLSPAAISSISAEGIFSLVLGSVSGLGYSILAG